MMIKTNVMPFLLILLLLGSCQKTEEWDNLNSEAVRAYKSGQYSRATVLAEQALNLAKKELGNKHSNTLTSMNNLAELYKLQGRYEKAEPLSIETMALSKEVLGIKHPDTLSNMNNLAELYK